MQRINVLLNKISELSRKAEKVDLIEVDLMLDYTRVLYADLVELRSKKVYTSNTASIDEILTKTEDQLTEKEEQVDITIEVPVKEIITPTAATSTIDPKNIKKFIGINDKYQFISELFDNNTESYDKVITKINTFSTSHKALEWLDTEIYEERGWDETNDSVKMFYDTVSNFFSSI